MKKYLNFIFGFVTCLIIIITTKYVSNVVYADNNKEVFNFTKVSYPIYSNNIKTNITAYNFKGNTYLKIVDLNNLLYGINITWDEENFRVNMDNVFEPNTLEYENNQYYELPKIIIDRYCNNTKIPYLYFAERDTRSLGSIKCLVYIGNEHRITNQTDYDEICFNGIFLNDKIYIPKDEYYNNISKLIKMIIENENYIKLNPESIK